MAFLNWPLRGWTSGWTPRRTRGAATAGPEEIKDSRAGPLIALTSAGRARWTPRDYASLAAEGFAKNAVAYRCVRMIAEASAATPLIVFAGGARDDAHPVARLLAKPNPEQAGAEWLEGVYGALQTAGNAYVEAVGEDLPQELWSLRPDRVTIVPGRAGWPEAYEYAVGGRKVRIGREADGWMPVMQLKLWNPGDDHYGFSPLEAAAFAIDVHNASGAWNKALLDNAARPSGALVFGARDGERLSEAQFALLKAEMSEAHAGAVNAGRPLMLEGGLDWKPMSMSPAEMDFIAGKHAAAREIALAFGVPPQLLGIPGDATYANYRGQCGLLAGDGGAAGQEDGRGVERVAGRAVRRGADRARPGRGAGPAARARCAVVAAVGGGVFDGRGAAADGGGRGMRFEVRGPRGCCRVRRSDG